MTFNLTNDRLPRTYLRGKWYLMAVLVMVTLSHSDCCAQDGAEISYYPLTGEIADYSEIFSSEDGELILTRDVLKEGKLELFLIDQDNFSNQIKRSILIPVESEDQNMPVYVMNFRKYNGLWYVHLKGSNEYIVQVDIIMDKAVRVYSSRTAVTLTYQDFYIDRSGELFLYKWTSGENVAYPIEVTKVINGNPITVLGLEDFVPEGVVAFSTHYKCIDVHNNRVFVLDPVSGAITSYSLPENETDEIRASQFPLEKKKANEMVRLIKKYKRVNSYKIFNQLVQFENELVHYEKIIVFNDSVLLINGFSYENGHIRDSLIFYNFIRKRTEDLISNQWAFSDSTGSDQARWFYLYYRNWAVNKDRLFVVTGYSRRLDDPELKRPGELYQQGDRPYKYLWSVKFK